MPIKLSIVWVAVSIFVIASCGDSKSSNSNGLDAGDDMGPVDMAVDLNAQDMTATDMTADMTVSEMDMSSDAGADADFGDSELDMNTDAGDASDTDVSDANPADLPDTCLTAEPIVLSGANVGMVSGQFAGHTDANTLSSFCSATGPGVDSFFSLEVPAGTWDIEIDTIGSTTDTALSVAFDCQSFGQAVCNDDFDQNQGSASRVWLHQLVAAQSVVVFIAVDDAGGVGGDYVLNVQLSPAAPDQCLSITTRPLDITGGGTVLGVINRPTGSSAGSCETGVSGPEAVFRANADGTTTMSLTAVSADFVPDIYVRGGCGSADLGCATGASVGNLQEATLNVVPGTAGQRFVFLEGSQGSYVLNYSPL